MADAAAEARQKLDAGEIDDRCQLSRRLRDFEINRIHPHQHLKASMDGSAETSVSLACITAVFKNSERYGIPTTAAIQKRAVQFLKWRLAEFSIYKRQTKRSY